MPTVWDKDINKVAVQLNELVPDWWSSYEALKMKINRESNFDYGIRRLQRGCKNNQVLIDFDTLPREIQEALGDPRRCQHIMEKWYRWDSDAVRFFNDFTFEEGGYLSDKHKNEYVLNASVLKAVHRYKEEHIIERSKKGQKAMRLYEFMAKEAQAFQAILKTKHGNIQHTLPASDRNFRTIYDKFFQKGTYNGREYDLSYAELVDGRLKNENAKVVTSEIETLLNSMFAKAGSKPNKLKVAKRYRLFKEGLIDIINTKTGEQYNPADYKQLDERTITKWLSKWQNQTPAYVLRQADRQKAIAISRPYIEMELPEFSGSLYSVDDRQPPFEYGPSQRLWLYNGLDVGSDAITATVWGRDKKGMILDFYRQILRNYTEWGIRLPAELEAETSLNISYKDSFLAEGAMFDWVRLEANNARGKIIENRNRRFRLELEKELEGWKGRPFAKDEANQPMPKDNQYNEQSYRSYESLVQQSLMIIEDWNNSPHPKHKDMTRWDYFMSKQNPRLHPTNWKAILPHLGYHDKSSCHVGRIRLQGRNLFIGDNNEVLFGEPLIERLMILENQDVVIHWLDANDGAILKALIYLGDTFICEGIPVVKPQRARIERTEKDDELIQIQQRYSATVEGFIKNRKNEIDPVLIVGETNGTLNSNFQMPGLNRYLPDNDDALPIDEPDDSEFVTPTLPSQSILNKF